MARTFISFVSIFILLLGCYSAKKASRVVFVKNEPVREGNISIRKERLSRYSDPSNFVDIESADSTVLSLDAARIIDVFTLDAVITVTTKTNYGRFFLYTNLHDAVVERGDTLSKGDLIGTAIANSRGRFVIVVGINDNGTDLNYYDVVDFFKQRVLP